MTLRDKYAFLLETNRGEDGNETVDDIQGIAEEAITAGDVESFRAGLGLIIDLCRKTTTDPVDEDEE